MTPFDAPISRHDLTAPLPRTGVTLPPEADRFQCVKFHKHLYIQDLETGALVYAHPDFIRCTDRALIQDLARRATARGTLDISDIIRFETLAPRARGYTPRPQDRAGESLSRQANLSRLQE
ncbi:hypothetical protein [Pararhodobacter sp. SW119]|uniref:hypothetical protein n=1 Tax=Pararhodobacter sp. SW119 TaxID=2780075 RepID=UPI001ADEBFC2|nr:hypothetical protein [Pararhodobacter sp. SW119]